MLPRPVNRYSPEIQRCAWRSFPEGLAQSDVFTHKKNTSRFLQKSRGFVRAQRSSLEWFVGDVRWRGLPGGSEVKASACNAGDLGSIPGSGRSPGEGNGNPLQYSCLENPMDRGAWWATVHGVAKSQTRLGDFTFTQMKREERQPGNCFGLLHVLWFSDFRILNITERSVELMRLNFTFYEKFGNKGWIEIKHCFMQMVKFNE